MPGDLALPRSLPLPFAASSWPRRLAPAAAALWDWHLYLGSPEAMLGPAVPETIHYAAHLACERHDLSPALLAEQVDAAVVLGGAVRFDDRNDLYAFVQAYAGSHARLLAGLAGLGGRWHAAEVDELARGFYLTGRLAALADDLHRDRLFIPVSELEAGGVSLEKLQEGRPDEAVRRLLWKQEVRARDALAHGVDLHRDLRGRLRRTFKRVWLGAQVVLDRIARRDYDVWTEPIDLKGTARFRVSLHALTGRRVFGRR